MHPSCYEGNSLPFSGLWGKLTMYADCTKHADVALLNDRSDLYPGSGEQEEANSPELDFVNVVRSNRPCPDSELRSPTDNFRFSRVKMMSGEGQEIRISAIKTLHMKAKEAKDGNPQRSSGLRAPDESIERPNSSIEDQVHLYR